MFTAPVPIGIGLAPAIVGLGRLSGLDRDRALCPVTLIVIAAYYVLFATRCASGQKRAEVPQGELLGRRVRSKMLERKGLEPLKMV